MASSKITTSIAWKLLERGGFHGIKLLIQIILARILMPEDFGALVILMMFVDLCTIFVQSGLNTALIQTKNATDEDFSSVFWVSLGLSVILYAVLFLTAPWVAAFYNNQALTLYLRVIGTVLIGGAVNSIQIAYSTRQFNFRIEFICNSVASTISGVISIVMARRGAGAWALIVQQLIWQYLNCVLMFIFIKWRPMLVFNVTRVKELISFGWKMLGASLLMRINTIAGNLIVGKRFSADSLAYYNKALNFPTAFCDVVVSAFSSVALVSVSSVQDEKAAVKSRMQFFVQTNCFFMAPMLIGMACVAKAFVQVLLTDTWLGCVPFLQIFCVMYLFQPLCAIYSQTISGAGRSDLYFRTLAIAKPVGFVLMILMAIFTSDATYLAVSLLVATMVETVIQAMIVRKLFGHSLKNQLKDWLQPISAAVIMAVPVCALTVLEVAPLLMLVLQITVGAFAYAIASFAVGCPIARNLVAAVVRKLYRRNA